MSGRRGSSVVHDTTYDPLVEEPLSGGAHDSLRVLRPDPPLLPSIIFPLGPPFCGDQCRAERALGCGGIFPRGQQAGATGEEAAEGRKCEGGAVNGSGRSAEHTSELDPLVELDCRQLLATIIFEYPAQIPRSS